MSFTIIKANEEIEVKNAVVMIYGQPGVGKSSIAFTGKRPLTLDFDNGAHRSGFRKDTVRITKWSEVQELLRDKSVLADYDTIVVDTVGRALDCIVAAFDKTSKSVTIHGNPTQQGWGELKAVFGTFASTLRLMGKDLVLIAHEKEEKKTNKRDTSVIRPDISGGSYAIVFQVADFVGRVFKVGNVTTLDFEPCEEYLGKNSARFPAIEVPDFAVEGDFLEKLIAKMKDAMGKSANSQREAVGKIASYRSTIAQCENANDLNTVLSAAKNEDTAEKKQIKALADAQAKAIGATFDKAMKMYVYANAKQEATTLPPQEPTPAPQPEPEPQPAPELPKPSVNGQHKVGVGMPAKTEAPAPEPATAAVGGDDEDNW